MSDIGAITSALDYVFKANANHDDLLPLSVEEVQLNLGGKNLLNDLSVEIESGGITIIMGPNGAGKSLFLRCLHGLIPVSSGRVTWGGVPTSDTLRRRQAMVFQRPVLLRRSVVANVHFAQRARGIVDNDAADALLGAMRLADLVDRPARKLSGGEQQRLALARALATQPDILFLDEPTASLDPASTRIIEDTVSTISERGVKIIFVTHNTHQAQRLADDLVFMADGNVCEHRSAADFFSAPQSPQADAYLSGRLPEI